jgi:1,4-dihydroxy-2-naphthoate polyprenyltransferase
MAQTLRQLIYLIRLGRPLFLAGGFVLHGLGVLMALSIGETLNLQALLWGQIAITTIQLMTHYSNDYFDLAADAANPTPTRWSGGSRILAEGLLPGRTGLLAALLWLAAAAIAILWLALIVRPGPLALPLLLLAAALGWSYSSPPLGLNNRGLGEITGAVLITGLTPIVGFYLQAGRLELLPFLAVFPLACLQFCMLLVINYPDAAGDMSVGKRTLLAVLGPRAALRLYLAILLLAYLSLPVLVVLGLPAAVALAVLAVSPIALGQGWRMARGAWADPAQWDSLGFWSIGLLMATAAAEGLGFLYLLPF